ncbi:MAG: roadblock/LC7 domain-containing protein [Desulfobulbaceae bacterium]|uniref:Roadblock/LC7 domain-containing protein n=1 Tax=Candidatus Desulfobia pelagia TaxID=2841692 RepID=A0A8J6TB74_9BACT|nr:roadblock/LC7 domain-containing protein [Candidatus Desulfobia pelagia]
MMYGVSQEQLEKIDTLLTDELLSIGVHCVIVIDTAGNTIAQLDKGKCACDVASFAALAAGNFAAVDAMAKLVGEEEFSLHFHRGESESIHFSKINDDLLLITIFGNDVSLGFLRLKTAEVIENINEIWGDTSC